MFSENISLLVKLLLDAKFERITIELSVVTASRLCPNGKDIQKVRFQVGGKYIKHLGEYKEEDISIELEDIENYINESL